MNGKIAFPTLACMVLCVQLSCAQQYLFTRYTPKDGLVNNRARFMFQDSKGRLYISTYGGLSVYDGSRFINYTTENGLATSLINDIVEMGDDSLWIVPNGSAMHCMVHGIIRDIKTADSFYPVTNQLLRTGNGHVYSIADQGLFRLENNRFIRIPIMGRTAGGEEKDVGLLLVQAIEYKGLLVILTDPFLSVYPGSANILVYNPKTGESIVPESSPGAYFLVKSPEGDLLVASRYGVRKIDPDSLDHHRVSLSRLPFPYHAADTLFSSYLYFDRQKNLWMASGNAIQKIDRKGKLRSFNAANGLPDGINNSIFQDGEDNMWFTNDQNGITMLASQEVEFYTEPRPGFIVNDLYADERSDSTWFYSASQRSLVLDTREGQKVFRGKGKLPDGGQIAIGKSAYMFTGDDLYALHFFPGKNEFRGSLIRGRDEDRGDPNVNTYSSALFDRQDNLVLTSTKLGIMLSGRLRQQPLHYLADQSAIDSHGRIWTITRANELFVFRRSIPDTGLQLIRRYIDGLPRVGPRSLTVDSGGHVWIGTRDHGLYCLFFDNLRLVSWTRLTTKDGLSENFINYLECDANGTIWACSPGGVDKIRLEKGHFIINNVTRSNAIYRSIFKIVPTREGVHWALAKGGIIKISPPATRNEHYLPSVLFSQVLVGNEPVTDFRKGLKLPYDRNAISFYVGATTFIDETQTRYMYLLEGSHEAKWSTPSDQSAINLIDLQPGKYTLRVKALFLTGRYPEQSAAYSFVITPPWWQTWWFRVVVAVALIGLSLLLIRRYIRRKLEKQRILLEKKQAVEKERTRIATDMHDDLGAGLSRIKFLSETIGIKKQQQMPIEEEISGIRQYSHDMIDKMGEIVWALNERNDSLSDLLSYTRSYAVEYLMQAGMVCEVEAPPADLPTRFVGGEFRRNVYLTIKEALHNIVKHSQATRVFISMDVTGGRIGSAGKTGKGENLIIVIRDNGIGFDKNHIRPFSNGLNNMEKRITSIGGTLVIGHGSMTAVNPGAGGSTGITVRIFVPV